jgi:glycosyltransferase involved in cell wall biosynthesis
VKILLVADFSVVHSRRYLHLIQKAGCDVVLLDAGRRAYPFSKRLANDYYLWPRRGGERFTRCLIGPGLAANLSEAVIRVQLRLLCTIARPDIVHVQWVGDRAWSFARAGIAPLVLTAWGSDLNRIAEDPNYDTSAGDRIAEVISKTALLIADSQSIVDIANSLVTSTVPSMLLPIGIDTRLFRPGLKGEAFKWRRELGIPDTAKVVLSPRALKQNYNHGTILRAFACAVLKRNFDAYLVFKAYDCADTKYAREINTIGRDCGIRDRIRIMDEVAYERLPIFYAMGDFAVNFPTMDAFPVTFLECLACELPILSIRLPAYENFGMPAYLQFTVAATEESLENSISDLLAPTHVRQDMTRARAYVSANFDESAMARDLGRAYENVLKQRTNVGSIPSIGDVLISK